MALLFQAISSHAFEPSMMIQNIFTCIGTLILLYQPTKKSLDWKPLLWHFPVLMVSLILMNGVLHIAGFGGSASLLSHLLLYVGYAWSQKLMPRWNTTLSILLYHAIRSAAVCVSGLFPVVLRSFDNGSVLEILLRNGVVIGSVAVAWLFRLRSMLVFPHLHRTIIVYGFLMSGITLILCTWFNFLRSWELPIDTGLFHLFVYFSIMILNLVSYFLAWSVCHHSRQEREALAENYSLKSSQYMLELSTQNLEEMRKIRHDINNHFSYIQLLNQEGRTQELNEYLQAMNEDIALPLSRFDFGNKAINAILNLELTKAIAKGIELDCRVIVPPELPFAEIRLCSLLTNLIDNALEACERDHISDATVEVGLNQSGSMLYLCVLNPLPEGKTLEDINAERTSKKDTLQHGYGMQIVKSIVNDYNGRVRRSIDQGRFRVDVFLDMQWEADQKRSAG